MWKQGGGTSWAWITYDPDTNQIFYGTSQPGTFNPDMRPGDNKWGASIFARNADKFTVPARKAEEATDDVFLVGLQPNKAYHVEVDGEEMVEEMADPGGIIFLPGLPTSAVVRLTPAPVFSA